LQRSITPCSDASRAAAHVSRVSAGRASVVQSAG
jgi:hypothetical protein